MTGDEFKSQRLALGLTQGEMAEILGTTLNTVYRWESGLVNVNEGWARLALAEAARRRRPEPGEDGRRGPRRR